MSVGCACGAKISDAGDSRPNEVYLIPHQEMYDFWNAIDEAIEKSGPTAKDKEAACMNLRYLIGNVTRFACQCRECGRVYIQDQERNMQEFVPASDAVPRELFRSRPPC